MKVIIIEDEKPAAEKLKKLVLQCDAGIEVQALLNSVHAATEWLNHHPAPDLIFMDIELTDGLSFRILEQCKIACPVIFVTAYDEYWRESLEQNGIDYLLKPVRQEKLDNALQKYKKLQQHFLQARSAIRLSPPQAKNEYRKRFLIKKGTDFISVRTNDIAYCYAAHKLVFIVDNKAQRFILDKSLNDLEKELDPEVFFRINRKYLANIHHIRRIKSHAKSKLMVELNPPAGEEIIISQENALPFKQWIDN